MAGSFSDSYIGQLRKKIGNDMLLIPGAQIVLEDDQGRIVMIRRADNGLWALPAGSAEPGESIADTARREVLEETGLILNSFKCFGYASDPARWIYTYPNGHQIQSFSLLLCSTDYQGIIGNHDDEVLDVQFLALDTLPPSDQVCANEYYSIACYRKYKKTGEFQWA